MFTRRALPVSGEGELPSIRPAQARKKRVKRNPHTDFEQRRTCYHGCIEIGIGGQMVDSALGETRVLSKTGQQVSRQTGVKRANSW